MHRPLTALGLGVVLLAGAACGDDDDGSEAVGVIASTNVWGSVAEAVGGDLVDVESLVSDPSADPHSLEVTPQQRADLDRADLVVYNGGGYDEAVAEIVGDRERAVDVFALSGREGNEHVWYDLPTVQRAADEIAKQLAAIDPGNSGAYSDNARVFRERIDRIAAQVTPAPTDTNVAATEPVSAYLLAAAGLVDVTPPDFVEAVEEEGDPPAAAVADIRRLVTERQVALLVFNPQTETPVTESLRDDARRVGVPVVEMTETLPADLDYATWMERQVRALGDALP